MEESTLFTVLASAASGLVGATVGSIVPFLLNRKVSKVEYDLKKAERDLKAVEMDKANSYRFGDAFARLQDDSLGVRMGALFELKKLGLAMPEEQRNIVKVLSPFIRERIENRDLLVPSRIKKNEEYDWKKPAEDVYLACEITSLFYDESFKCDKKRRAALAHLNAEKVDMARLELRGADLRDTDLQGTYFFKAALQGANLRYAKLQGANLVHAYLQEARLVWAELQGADLWGAELQMASLSHANFQRARLVYAELQGANLTHANLQGTNLNYAKLQEAALGWADLQESNLFRANLQGANLRGAKNLTVEQLLHATIDDTTLLDDDLRVEYEKLKAAQET